MKKSALLIFVFFILSISVFAAASMEIYIHNRPVQGAVITQGDEVYITAAELKKLIKGNIEWDEKAGTVTIDGNQSTIKLLKSNNTVFLPLKATSKALGYNFSYNRSTGIMDVFKQTAFKPGTTAVAQPAQSPAPGASPSPTPSGTPQFDPLTITPTNVTRDNAGSQSASGIRYFCDVTNGRSTEARNVVGTCVLNTMDGKVFNKMDVNVGNIPAGQKKEAIFYFTSDGGGIQLNPTYTVTSDK